MENQSTRPKILIVDDERLNLRLMEGVLRDFEADIHLAESGDEAINLVKRGHDFALLLLDVMMPIMDGFQVAEAVRAIEHARNVPIIFVTAISKEQQHVFRGYELGAVDYLFKPVEPEVLRGKVKVFTDLWRYRSELEHTTEQLTQTISELRTSQQKLEESEERYRTVADHNYDWESWIAPNGDFIYVSPSCERISGYPRERFLEDPKFIEGLIHVDDLSSWRSYLADDSGAVESFDFRIFHRNTRERWLSMVKRGVLNDKGEYLGVRCSMRDVTSRKSMEERIRHQSLHDPLTGLANRTLCLDRVRQAQVRTERTGSRYALAFIDLDRFKIINDSMGHAFGDRFLLAVGKRLLQVVRRIDTVARIGGDEFIVLFEDLQPNEDIIKTIKRLSEALREPYDLGGESIRSSASVGLFISNGKNLDPEDAVQNANLAMYQAKENGKDCYYVFKQDLRDKAQRIMSVENELRLAIDRNEFVTFFQPLVDLTQGHLSGFEALVRWKHPEKGLVGPGVFIPVAEETGLIGDIGRLVLEDACATMKSWMDRFDSNHPCTMSVNISARQLSEPTLVDDIRGTLGRTGLDPQWLKLEITETVAMVDAMDSARKFTALRELGISLAIDDFGTGYSSMSYLQKFAVDQLKVDMSFIRGMENDPEKVEIVRAIVNMAHSLRLKVVAEGIENAQQRGLLYSLQCDYGQGYLLGRPMPGEEAVQFFGKTI